MRGLKAPYAVSVGPESGARKLAAFDLMSALYARIELEIAMKGAK